MLLYFKDQKTMCKTSKSLNTDGTGDSGMGLPSKTEKAPSLDQVRKGTPHVTMSFFFLTASDELGRNM